MPRLDYRIESSHQITGRFLPASLNSDFLLSDRELAIVVAAKSETSPIGQEIRVVHIPTGDVVFRKTASAATSLGSLTAFDDT
jgi:hypothetical protein